MALIRQILLFLVIIWRVERVWQTAWIPPLISSADSTPGHILLMAEFLREAVNDTSQVQRAKDHVWLLESAATIIIIIGCFFFW